MISSRFWTILMTNEMLMIIEGYRDRLHQFFCGLLCSRILGGWMISLGLMFNMLESQPLRLYAASPRDLLEGVENYEWDLLC